MNRARHRRSDTPSVDVPGHPHHFVRRFVPAALAMAAIALAGSPIAQAASKPALFRAGAAIRSINPSVPVYAGGFSLSPPITKVHDPLEVRAFYLSNGHAALAFATIDAQGYFSGYEEGPDVGALADRVDAARAASVSGRVRMTPT